MIEIIDDTNLDGLIDYRNQEFYRDLISDYDITVHLTTDNYYRIFSIEKEKRSVIYVSANNKNPASFTHELLHAFLRDKNIFIGWEFKRALSNYSALRNVFDSEFFDHIANSLEHVLMFPLFLELGFKPYEFLADFTDDKLTEYELQDIRKHFSSKRLFYSSYNKPAIRFFIGKFFAVFSDFNKNHDYTNRLVNLKSIDSDLYKINEVLFQSWLSFDINNLSSIKENYDVFLLEYIKSLEVWVKGKRIVE